MSDKDFAHFVEIAYSSLMEVVSQTQVALRQSYTQSQLRNEIYDHSEQLARMLSD